MRRLLLYTALALLFRILNATAADHYGEWLLERPRSFELTLTFKQSVPIDNKIATSELGFICDQRGKLDTVGIILVPFDGTFENRQKLIPVLIQKNKNEYDPSDLLQHWSNGTDYIFLESKDDVDELAAFLRTNETDGAKYVHFYFPNDPDSGPQISNHIVIGISGFSEGFAAFKASCAASQ